MLKPLLRTIVSLSGNVKLACMLTNYEKESDGVYNAYVRDGKLIALANKVYQYPLNVSLSQSSYEYDLYKFYSRYSNVFYDNCFTYNQKEINEYDPTNLNITRNVNCEYGCKRISYSKNKYQFAFFAPIYCESIDDMPDYFEMKVTLSNNSFHTTRNIKINIGSNKDHNDNYLYRYISSYLKKINSDVIYCTPQIGAATYYGINVLSGGFTQKSDALFNNIYTKQYTINLFDHQICKGFERNKMVMKQIIPLSFYFNINDMLDYIDKLKFRNCEVKVSGSYYKDGKELDFYDFNIDYDYYNQDVLRYNELTYEMGYTTNNTNCMDVDFPALHDMRYIKNQYANKVNILHTRWKMIYSDDDHPYITNLNYGYSSDYAQGYSKYQTYPSRYYQLQGEGEIMLDNKYNILLPSKPNNPPTPPTIPDERNYISTQAYDDAKAEYEEAYKLYKEHLLVEYNKKLADYNYYLTIQNNYSTNWFSVLHHDTKLFDNDWYDVINNKTYVNGILYNLNEELNYYKETYNIDKFNMFVYINHDSINESTNKHRLAYNLIDHPMLYSKTGGTNTIFYVNDIIYNTLNDDNIVVYGPNEITSIYEYNPGYGTDTSIPPIKLYNGHIENGVIIFDDSMSQSNKEYYANIQANPIKYVKESLNKYFYIITKQVGDSNSYEPKIDGVWTMVNQVDYNSIYVKSNDSYVLINKASFNSHEFMYDDNGNAYAKFYYNTSNIITSVNNNGNAIYYKFIGVNINEDDYIGYMTNRNSIKAKEGDLNIEKSGKVWNGNDTSNIHHYNLINKESNGSSAKIYSNKYIIEHQIPNNIMSAIDEGSYNLYDIYYKELLDDGVTDNPNCIKNIMRDNNSCDINEENAYKFQAIDSQLGEEIIKKSLGTYIDSSDLDIDYYDHNTYYLAPNYLFNDAVNNFHKSCSKYLIQNVYIELPIYSFDNIKLLLESNLSLCKYLYVYIYDMQQYYNLYDFTDKYDQLYNTYKLKYYPYISFYIQANVISKENYTLLKFHAIDSEEGNFDYNKICTTIPLYFEQTPVYNNVKYNTNIFKYQLRKNYGKKIVNDKTANRIDASKESFSLNTIYKYDSNDPDTINFNNENLINNDNDLLWVDTYNLKRVYNLDNGADQSNPKYEKLYTKEFYATFIDMKHINLYISKIWKSDNDNNKPQIYIRIPNIRYDKYFNCYIEYTYEPIDIDDMQLHCTYDNSNNIFIYTNDEGTKKQVVLCFKKTFALVDRHIYNYILSLSNYVCPNVKDGVMCGSTTTYNKDLKRFECPACGWTSTDKTYDYDDDKNNNGLVYSDLYLYVLSSYNNDHKNMASIEYQIEYDSETCNYLPITNIKEISNEISNEILPNPNISTFGLDININPSDIINESTALNNININYSNNFRVNNVVDETEGYWEDYRKTYSPDINSKCSEGMCLRPLFNDVYLEDVEESAVYSSFKLNDIYNVSFTNQDSQSHVDNRFIYYNSLDKTLSKEGNYDLVITDEYANVSTENNSQYKVINSLDDDVYNISNNANYIKFSMKDYIMHDINNNKDIYTYKKIFKPNSKNINNSFIGYYNSINRSYPSFNVITKIESDSLGSGFNNNSELNNVYTGGALNIDINKLSINRIKLIWDEENQRYNLLDSQFSKSNVAYNYYFKEDVNYTYTQNGELLVKQYNSNTLDKLLFLYSDNGTNTSYKNLTKLDDLYYMGISNDGVNYPISFNYPDYIGRTSNSTFTDISYNTSLLKIMFNNDIENEHNIKFYVEDNIGYITFMKTMYFTSKYKNDNHLIDLNYIYDEENAEQSLYIYNLEGTSHNVLVNNIETLSESTNIIICNTNIDNNAKLELIKSNLYYKLMYGTGYYYMISNDMFELSDTIPNALDLIKSIKEYALFIKQNDNILSIKWTNDNKPKIEHIGYNLVLNDLYYKQVTNFYDAVDKYLYYNDGNYRIYLNEKNEHIYLDDVHEKSQYIIKQKNKYGGTPGIILNECIIDGVAVQIGNDNSNSYVINYDNYNSAYNDKQLGFFIDDSTEKNIGMYINILPIEASDGSVSYKINMSVPKIESDTFDAEGNPIMEPFMYFVTDTNTGKKKEIIKCINRFPNDDNPETFWVEIEDYDSVPYINMITKDASIKPLYVIKSTQGSDAGSYYIKDVIDIIKKPEYYYVYGVDTTTITNENHNGRNVELRLVEDSYGNYIFHKDKQEYRMIIEYITDNDINSYDSYDNSYEYDEAVGIDIDYNSEYESTPHARFYFDDTYLYKMKEIYLFQTDGMDNVENDKSSRNIYNAGKYYIKLQISEGLYEGKPHFYFNDTVWVTIDGKNIFKDNYNIDKSSTAIYSKLNVVVNDDDFNYYIDHYGKYVVVKSIEDKYLPIEVFVNNNIYYLKNNICTLFNTDINSSELRYVKIYEYNGIYIFNINYTYIKNPDAFNYNYKIAVINSFKNHSAFKHYVDDDPYYEFKCGNNIITYGYKFNHLMYYETFKNELKLEGMGEGIIIGENATYFTLYDYISEQEYIIKYDGNNTYYVDAVGNIKGYGSKNDGIFVNINTAIIKDIVNKYYPSKDTCYYISKFIEHYIFDNASEEMINKYNSEHDLSGESKLNPKTYINNINGLVYDISYIEICYPLYKYNGNYYIKNNSANIINDIIQNTNNLRFIYEDYMYSYNPVSDKFSNFVTAFLNNKLETNIIYNIDEEDIYVSIFDKYIKFDKNENRYIHNEEIDIEKTIIIKNGDNSYNVCKYYFESPTDDQLTYIDNNIKFSQLTAEEKKDKITFERNEENYNFKVNINEISNEYIKGYLGVINDVPYYVFKKNTFRTGSEYSRKYIYQKIYIANKNTDPCTDNIDNNILLKLNKYDGIFENEDDNRNYISNYAHVYMHSYSINGEYIGEIDGTNTDLENNVLTFKMLINQETGEYIILRFYVENYNTYHLIYEYDLFNANEIEYLYGKDIIVLGFKSIKYVIDEETGKEKTIQTNNNYFYKLKTDETTGLTYFTVSYYKDSIKKTINIYLKYESDKRYEDSNSINLTITDQELIKDVLIGYLKNLNNGSKYLLDNGLEGTDHYSCRIDDPADNLGYSIYKVNLTNADDKYNFDYATLTFKDYNDGMLIEYNNLEFVDLNITGGPINLTLEPNELFIMNKHGYNNTYNIQLNNYDDDSFIWTCNVTDGFDYYINNGVDENDEDILICINDIVSYNNTTTLINDKSPDLGVLKLELNNNIINSNHKIMYYNNKQFEYNPSNNKLINVNGIYGNKVISLNETDFNIFDMNYYSYYVNPKTYSYEYSYSSISDLWFIDERIKSTRNICNAYRVNSSYNNLLLININDKNNNVISLIHNKLLENPLMLKYLTTYNLYNDSTYKFISKDTLPLIEPISKYNGDMTYILNDTYSSNDSNLIITNYNGLTYGYYIINVDFLNDESMMNYYIATTGGASKIKLISYINGVNIIDNPNYIDNVFKIILPFTNIDLFGHWQYIKSIMHPYQFKLNIHNRPINIDNQNNDSDRYDIINSGNITNLTMYRYFDAIKPYIVRKTKILNMYDLKYKDTKISLIKNANNNFNGDSVIYKHNVSIKKYPGVGLFNERSITPYKYVMPYEYKFFNDNHFINLSEEIIIPYTNGYVNYGKLLELESFEVTFDLFKKFINNKNINTYSEDEILFLYNKYDKIYLSEPKGLDGSEKVYSLKYKFTLQ